MSKRHHTSRRKSYGRRQHELHERRERQHHPDLHELDTDEFGPLGMPDRMGFLDPRTPRLAFGE